LGVEGGVAAEVAEMDRVELGDVALPGRRDAA
jgi:hypothetical protein